MSCANTKCKWHRRDGGGCKLFEGRAWELCRQAKPSAKSAKTKKGNTK